MSDEPKQDPKVAPISADELSQIRDAMSRRYGLRLRPGETMTVDAARDDEHCWARIEISTADDTHLTELECASVAADVPSGTKWDAGQEFTNVLDLLDAQLDEYFENDRFARFHDDWRVYEFESSQLRFRGREGHPALEALADAWLAGDGDPAEGEPN